MVTLENKKFGYKHINKLLPSTIEKALTMDATDKNISKTHNYNTRSKNIPNLPKTESKCYLNSFLCQWVKDFVNIPKEYLQSINVKVFAKRIKSDLFKEAK